MAHTTQDTTLLPESTGKEVKEKVVESERGVVEGAEAKHVQDGSSSTPFVAASDPHVEKTSSLNLTDAQPVAPPSRPSLVPLGSSHASLVAPAAPHPKRFSAVNINKKFLEKNSSASGSAATSSHSSTTKSGSPVARPSIQPTSSHSRLVTAKLTASPAVSSSTAGWSRPSSVAPSPATNSPSSTSPLPTAAPTQSATTSAPQLPHVGKVIQPQPRAAIVQPTASLKESGNSKPVWGNVKPPNVPSIWPDIQASDFPTAAEVANVTLSTRKPSKVDEAKTTSDTAAKQARLEEADTFRGVHLDPNAHHWDEMEEDDGDFLAGVIEFGDGRQYKIESNDPQQPQAEGDAMKDSASIPISKEDRFVDDFDRSWPRSRNSPATISKDFPPPIATHSTSPSVSPVISHAAHSPQDSSRVLFNERSNRLEPYSQAHRTGQPSFNAKRSSYQDPSGTTTDPRSARDGPHNVQVLQKPSGGDFAPRGRRSSASSSGFGPGPSNGFVGDRQRGEHPTRRDGPPPSPRLHRETHQLHAAHGADVTGSDRGRRNVMGPPPVPAHVAQKHAQEGARQLPPHLSQVSPNVVPRRLPSRDSRHTPSEPPLSAGLPPSSARFPPPSPALSHASLALASPAAGSNTALPMNAPELDEARKDVMQSAAVRAKQRRQQEEEEREAQKERARRKAAELEEKMKVAEAEKAKQKEVEEAAAAKEREAVAMIEEAVKGISVSTNLATTNEAESADVRLPLRRPPSLKPVSRQSTIEPLRSSGPRRTGTIPPRSAPLSAPMATSAASQATQTDSWRAKANPLPPPVPQQIQPRSTPTPTATFIAPPPSALEQIEFIADGLQDDLEVVDFSDMGKFVGIPDVAGEDLPEKLADVKLGSSVLARASRPVASDFFDEPPSSDNAVSASKKSDFGAWRRKVSQDNIEQPLPPRQDVNAEVVEGSTSLGAQRQTTQPSRDLNAPKDQSPDTSFSSDTASSASMTSTKEPLNQVDPQQVEQIVTMPSQVNPQRTPRSQPFYKEAAMSALDDAMLRIKGVLVGMHTPEKQADVRAPAVDQSTTLPRTPQVAPPQTPSRSSTAERWVPPALRPRNFDHGDEPREVFLVTVVVPPIPQPATETPILVRLPSESHSGGFIGKKQLLAFSRPPFQPRMDILSFDPPVFDMNRRDLSLNDVLFRKPTGGFKGKFRYRVMLPRYRGPKVHMPSANLAKPGAFGRPTVADGATSWRKSALSPTIITEEIGLNTMSRSPPPDILPSDSSIASNTKSSEDSPTITDGGQAAIRSRTQPKMPVGSAVAFYRDSRIDAVQADSTLSVNFIVGSELEDVKAASPMPDPVISISTPLGAKRNNLESNLPPVTIANGIITSTSTTSALEGKEHLVSSSASDDEISTDRSPITPPSNHHAASSWARSSVSIPLKDSPARPPDPEHLKAVWSQTSNQAGLHPVNSLKGIADDLTALPFTLQDVKSEDGETPPPSLPTAPSRMSLHEVTRAFQQVPASSSTSTPSSHRTPISPPLTNSPVARPTYPYAPIPQNNMRPTYYAAPMMSHSPAPVMYPHPMTASPVPRMQVNGHTSLYSQPMWMSIGGPSPQGHGNMMRAVPSPYPAQMMPYPSPGYAPQPQPQNMIPQNPQAQNGGRGRGMPVMSPVMSHAHAHPGPAMYPGSPVLLHMQVPQNHGYMPVPAGRGQARPENGQVSNQQHPSHNNHHPPSHAGFNPAPNSPFVRSAW
ncbi:hypothetical protein B0H34DRAFT_684989 [Crassisporium funariophilum]|nr:hypothetical protein B0H34DRAFT_684989 [Crassisporium funariophilum]